MTTRTSLLTSPAVDSSHHRSASASVPASRAAVIVNGSKLGTQQGRDEFRAEVAHAFESLGWPAPLWLETTSETRGREEARWARAEEVDVVLVAGGDGTVRTVAQELTGSGIPLAILPMGTGNLLARSLHIPRQEITAAVQIACLGETRAMDVGWLELETSDAETESFAFLVMAGAGYDAEVMLGADQPTKARFGPAAYVMSGMRSLRKKPNPTTIAVDGVVQDSLNTRGVIVGNSGSLTMGLTLMPDADPTDGVLDALALLPTTIFGWALIARHVATRDRRDHGLMPRFRGRQIEVRMESPQLVEVDGDVVGEASCIRFRVQDAALLVRCAAATK